MPRILASFGGGGTATTVATLNPSFDNFAFQDTNDDIGSDEWTLGSASSTSLTLGYKDTLTDPAIHDYWYHVGLDFSLTSIPTSATVTAVSFKIRVTGQDGTGGNFAITKKFGGGDFASVADAHTFWDEAAGGGTSYGTLTPSSAAPATYTITLGAAAVTEAQAIVTAGTGKFTIALSETPALDTADVRRFLSSVDAASNKPELIVTYTTTSAAISHVTRARFPRIR